MPGVLLTAMWGVQGVWVVWVIQLIFSKNTNLWSKKVGLGGGGELFLVWLVPLKDRYTAIQRSSYRPGNDGYIFSASFFWLPISYL